MRRCTRPEGRRKRDSTVQMAAAIQPSRQKDHHAGACWPSAMTGRHDLSRDFSYGRPAQRPHRHRRAQRRGQIDAPAPDRGRAAAGQRHGRAGRDGQDRPFLAGGPRAGSEPARIRLHLQHRAARSKTDEGTFSAKTRCWSAFCSRRICSRRPSAGCPAANGGGCICCPSSWRRPTCCCWTSRPTIWTLTTLSILEDYLQSFPGPIIAVSHDRFFLDKMADTIFEVRGGGPVDDALPATGPTGCASARRRK